ncbi:MAG: hypothetical protein RIC19_11750 [Phaeodactylibacter sp.]|uniref:hypothetical protein n=1 Tax=Phaeodactylibacter sp. TaxID=1940289 RepID=UPI0032EB960B
MTEQNRNTLEKALSQLPVYTPPDECWQEIGQELSAQLQEAPLQEALDALPAYAPPFQNWMHIADALDADAAEQPLREALSELPQYAPPEYVWAGISRELRPSARRIALKMMARVAAAIALLIGLWWAWPQEDAEPAHTSYAYARETIDGAFGHEADWGQADQLMQRAVQTFRRDPVARQLPTYELLLSEWADLQAAQEEISDMMDRYGKDAQLIRQMSKIEKERSGLIREMIAQI